MSSKIPIVAEPHTSLTNPAHAAAAVKPGSKLPFFFGFPKDPRYPYPDQTRRCQQAYLDHHRCKRDIGEDATPCANFKLLYSAICAPSWIEEWDEQVEKDVYPELSSHKKELMDDIIQKRREFIKRQKELPPGKREPLLATSPFELRMNGEYALNGSKI